MSGLLCGVVWCGVVWCGVVWCGVAWLTGVSSPSGNLEWLDKKKKDRCYIMWRSPQEWGSVIYQWVGGVG